MGAACAVDDNVAVDAAWRTRPHVTRVRVRAARRLPRCLERFNHRSAHQIRGHTPPHPHHTRSGRRERLDESCREHYTARNRDDQDADRQEGRDVGSSCRESKTKPWRPILSRTDSEIASCCAFSAASSLLSAPPSPHDAPLSPSAALPAPALAQGWP